MINLVLILKKTIRTFKNTKENKILPIQNNTMKAENRKVEKEDKECLSMERKILKF